MATLARINQETKVTKGRKRGRKLWRRREGMIAKKNMKKNKGTRERRSSDNDSTVRNLAWKEGDIFPLRLKTKIRKWEKEGRGK